MMKHSSLNSPKMIEHSAIWKNRRTISYRNSLLTLLAVVLLFLLGGCSGLSVGNQTTPTNSNITPTDDEDVVSEQYTQQEIDRLTSELHAELVDEWLISDNAEEPAENSSPRWTDVFVLPLNNIDGDNRLLWVAHPIGSTFFEDPPFFISVYTYTDHGWQEIDRMSNPNGDYFFADSTGQIEIDQNYIWLEVHSAAGAHSGFYDILYFDGTDLHTAYSIGLAHFNEGLTPVELKDLDDDGTIDVINRHVGLSSYGLGAGLAAEPVARISRWDGSKMADVELETFSSSELSEWQRANNLAVALADAGLWKDSAGTIDHALDLADSTSENDTLTWNAIFIRENAKVRAEYIEESDYPLMYNIYYGDYDAALEVMRSYSIEEIFARRTPLVYGTNLENALERFSEEVVTRSTPRAGSLGRSVWRAERFSEEVVTRSTSAIEVQPDLAAAYFVRGWVKYLVETGISHDIITDIERAAELESDEPLFSQSLIYFNTQPSADDISSAETLVERGEELAREGDFDEAISAYTEAIDLNPENGEAYNLRGVAYSRSGDDEQAIDDYTQAINHNHDPLALVYANRAVSYLRQDNYEQGIADATQAIELEPYDAGYYNLRGNIYFNAGDYAQALNDYTEAIDLAPDYDWAYSNRAGTHFRLQDIDAALRDARKAVELNPDEAEFQAILCLYGSLGKSVEMEACERAVELAPDNGAFRGRRGIARALTSDLAGAAEDFTFHKEWLETNFPNNTILIAEREAWIAALKSGENPIDEETLEALREFYK